MLVGVHVVGFFMSSVKGVLDLHSSGDKKNSKNSKTAGRVNKQLFALNFTISNLKGDDMSTLCSQLVSASPKWPNKSVIAGFKINLLIYKGYRFRQGSLSTHLVQHYSTFNVKINTLGVWFMCCDIKGRDNKRLGSYDTCAFLLYYLTNICSINMFSINGA